MDTGMYFGLLLTVFELLCMRDSAETHLAVEHMKSFNDGNLTGLFLFVPQLSIN